MSAILRHKTVPLFLIFLFLGVSVFSQVHTPRYNTPIGTNTKGFYEYLPQGYSEGAQNYPLIIFLHGKGDLGNGDAATLPRLLTYGLPKLIKDGKFPSSFTSDGTTHKFVVISPQFVTWPSSADVEQVINYAVSHYRVNVNRVYLTGLSMGGGGVWDYAGDNSIYANRLAAIVPICGSSYPESSKGRVIAAANLPVWATHNSGDDIVAVYKTNGYVDYINQSPAPLPVAKKTLFNAVGHDAWTKTYDPFYKEDGKNIYEWMLQYQRTVLTASSNSPVCFDSVLQLSAWNIEGARYNWTGPNNFTSSLREPVITPVTAQVAGVYSVTLFKDNFTATATTTVTVSVSGTFYKDGDQDGYGNPYITVNACRAPRGYIDRSCDCNDSSSKVFSGAPEICDGKDNDCNGLVDEGVVLNRYYIDSDNDGRGDAGNHKDSCAQPVGFVPDNTDCNDKNASVYAGALEILDGLDNDCNGKSDDNAVAAIKVNLFGGINPMVAADWNNWNVKASLNSGLLKYASAKLSSVAAALSNNFDVFDNGTAYNGGMAPAQVLRYTSSANTSRTLTISGLSTGKIYNLELYATRNSNSNYSTVFSVGATSLSVSTYKNLTSKADFVKLSPGPTGQIVVTIKNANVYSYLAGFLLTENTASPASAVAEVYADAEAQTEVMLAEIANVQANSPDLVSPFTVEGNSLKLVPSAHWTSGFFPGILWNLYEYTGKTVWAERAKTFTSRLEKEQFNAGSHDVGFKMYSSFGAGYRLTQSPAYRDVVIQTAKTLATRFNSKVGCFRSWDWNSSTWQFPVIVDNMMNLELLFAVTRFTGDSTFYNMAVSHANATLKNHFRPNYSSVHVVDYDTLTGAVRKRTTFQGYNDESSWARGQAWALYGFTMCYRETKIEAYLEQAQKIAAYLVQQLKMPADKIPYWDFDAPGIPSEPRDASAAAVMASALYELVKFSPVNAQQYRLAGDNIIKSLTEQYRSAIGENKGFLLLHSTGSYPTNSEVDKPLVYADYYYLEALLRNRDLTAEIGNTTNQSPTVNAGADQTITAPANSVTLNGSGADADGRIAAYTWCKVSGPVEHSFSSKLSAVPTIGNLVQGTYVFRLTVTDDVGAISSDDVQVIVNPSPVTTTTKYIKVNLFGGNNSYANADWNNWNVNASLVSGALRFSDATLSSISAGITKNALADNGASYGGTMAPPEVLRYASYASIERTITLSGLSATKVYSVELYASRANTGNSTVFTINENAQTVITDINKANKVTFSGLVPTASGQILIRLKNVNSYNYLNGFELREETPPPPSVTKALKVNLFGGSNPYPNPEWNNWNVSSSVNSGVLKYPDATGSGISAALSKHTLADNGATYGGTMAPAEVLRYTSYSTSARTLTFSGMITSKTYNLELYASRANTGNSTTFTANGTSMTILTDKNKTNKSALINLVPTAGGQLVVNIQSVNSYNYLNGFILTENSSNTITVNNSGREEEVLESHLQVFPNPSAGKFVISIKSKKTTPVQVRITDAEGRLLELKTGMPANGTLFIGDRFRPGVYFVEIEQEGKKAMLKLVKQ